MKGTKVLLRGKVTAQFNGDHVETNWTGTWAMDEEDFASALTSEFKFTTGKASLSPRSNSRGDQLVTSSPPNATAAVVDRADLPLKQVLGEWLRFKGYFRVRHTCDDSDSDKDVTAMYNDVKEEFTLQISRSTVYTVQGFGDNVYGKFSLSGTFDASTGLLSITKLYEGPTFCPTVLQLSLGEVYSMVNRNTGQLGGNAAGGAIYGEITLKSFQKVVDALKQYAGFSAKSSFVDIGSGLGKPNFHVAVDPGVSLSYGFELIGERWLLSLANIRAIVKAGAWHVGGRTFFANTDVLDLTTLEPFSHI